MRRALYLQTRASQDFAGGELAACEKKLREAVTILEPVVRSTPEALLKEVELQIAGAYSELASLCELSKRTDESIVLKEKALLLKLKYAASGSIMEISALKAKAKSLTEAGQFNEALLLLNEARSLSETKYGKDSLQVTFVLTKIASVLAKLERMDECAEMELLSVTIHEKLCAPTDPDLGTAYLSYALTLSKMKDLPTSEIYLRKALSVFEAPRMSTSDIVKSAWQSKGASLPKIALSMSGLEHPAGLITITSLITNLTAQKKFESLDELYKKALAIVTKRKPIVKTELKKIVERYARFLRSQNRESEALVLEKRFIH